MSEEEAIMKPKPKQDNYVGEVNPHSGLRHGTGTYKYSNPYFTYEGEWENGKKHGQGVLKFSDGGYIKAEF